MKASRATLFFIFSLPFLSSCGGYKYTIRGALNSFEAGDYERSLKILEEKSKGNKKEELLFLLDRATVAHTAGKYELSNRLFERSEELSEELNAISVTAELATVITDERILYYKGEDFERILINDFKGLNYLMLAQQKKKERESYLDEALVEGRRAHLKLESLEAKGADLYQIDQFAIYLSGLLYEMKREPNDAYIAYKRLFKVNPGAPYIRYLLLLLSKSLGFTDEYRKWHQNFVEPGLVDPSLLQKWDDPNSGDLIIIIENGSAPEKEPHPEFHFISEYRMLKEPAEKFELTVGSGQEAGLLVSDVADTAIQYHSKQNVYLITKRLAGFALKELAAEEIAKQTKSEEMGWLARIIFYSQTKADLRSWLTMPAEFLISRIKLKPGTYTATLIPTVEGEARPDLSKQFKDIHISPRTMTVLLSRFF